MDKKEKNHLIISKCFLRVVKNHKLYPIFYKGCKHFMTSSDYNRGREIKNVIDIFNIIGDIASKDYSVHRRSDNDKYEPTTFVINTLLRHLMERQCIEAKLKVDLGMLGQEIFDLSCYKIFGDEFLEDMEKFSQEFPKARNDEEMFYINNYKAFLDVKNLSSRDLPFNEFMKKYGKSLKDNYTTVFGRTNENDNYVNEYDNYEDDEYYEEDETW